MQGSGGLQKPGPGAEVFAVADGDGTAVELVGDADGAFDHADGRVDVEEGDDEGFAVDAEVVSEERKTVTRRLARRGLVNEDIFDFTH